MQYINTNLNYLIVFIFNTVEFSICFHVKCLILQECINMICLFKVVMFMPTVSIATVMFFFI